MTQMRGLKKGERIAEKISKSLKESKGLLTVLRDRGMIFLFGDDQSATSATPEDKQKIPIIPTIKKAQGYGGINCYSLKACEPSGQQDGRFHTMEAKGYAQ